MRLSTIVLILFCLSTACASAQDPGQQLMLDQQMQQQAAMQAQQAAQANQQAAQQANDIAMQAVQSNGCCAVAAKPRLSLKPGSYPASTTLRIKDSTRGAVVYYTTDGWTPTTHSTRYVGPIVLRSTTAIQAIAVAPAYARSAIVSALYTLPSPSPVSPQLDAGPHVTLYRGMPLALAFTAAVTSKGLEVGDTLPVALAQDLVVGGVLIAPRATPVLVTVTQVDTRGFGGAPGTLSFAVHSLTTPGGETVLLAGTETKEGEPHTRAANAVGVIPFVGIGGIFIRGREVEIPQGTTLTALVDSDMPVRAVQ